LTLSITPTKDGILNIYGKGVAYSGTAFLLGTEIDVNATSVDATPAGSTSAGQRMPFFVQASVPVVANATYTVILVAKSTDTSYIGIAYANSLIATVYYK